MMFNADDRPRVASGHRLLLGGWRDILDDVSRLATALQQVPDECGCGHGAAHLGGACPCCQAGEHPLDCVDCGALVQRLHVRVEAMREDSARFLPVVEQIVTRNPDETEERRARLRIVKTGIAAFVRTFERLEAAADEFRSGCSAVHLRAVKDLAGDLLNSARSVDSML